MDTIIHMAQIISAVLLILVILTQSRGSGLSSTFGGEGGFYASKRGVEKILFNLTIMLAAVFLLSSLSYTILQ